MQEITYKKAGVDVHRMDALKRQMKPLVRRSFRPEVLKDIGSFGAFFRFPKDKYRDPVLVSSADGVGTKLKVAYLCGKHDTVGIDAVAMNVNDILCTGAEPLFFLDYIAFSDLRDTVILDIVKGVNTGCVEADCSLIGGETAQMPGMYKPGEYDIAGFCVGSGERGAVIDGSRIRPGDKVIGLESNGLHSNGFSLVRKVFSQNELKRMGKELLRPTRIYVKPVRSLLRDTRYAVRGTTVVKGISHITGGAFYDKIARILPDTVDVRIDKNSWKVPEIFKLIQLKGRIKDEEIYHTLNMGIGMVLIAEADAAQAVTKFLSGHKLKSWIIGEVIKGKGEVKVF
ncbi:MAG: phosphoribosylformylglycinamidine cyclo-ligase [Candidatus Omnitrophota bacterium]|jgi:phosphoribosylformylglycinamidine cyclo-ligase